MLIAAQLSAAAGIKNRSLDAIMAVTRLRAVAGRRQVAARHRSEQ